MHHEFNLWKKEEDDKEKRYTYTKAYIYKK